MGEETRRDDSTNSYKVESMNVLVSSSIVKLK